MRRLAALMILMPAIALTIACGESSPTSASRTAAVPSLTPGTQSAAVQLGTSAVDLGHCFQTAAAGCFSARDIQARVVVGSAVTVPGAPSGLSATAAGNTVTLTWGAPLSGDPATTYAIEAGSAPGLTNLASVITGSTGTSFSAIGVGNGTYYVRGRALNAGGTSAASNEAILVVGAAGCTTAPNAPSGLVITTSGSTLTLTWAAPAGACAPTGYIIEAGSGSGQSNLAQVITGTTATSFTTTGVGAGTYYLRVRAVNLAGTSGTSNEATVTIATTGGTPCTLSPPSGLTATVVVDRVTFTWLPQAGTRRRTSSRPAVPPAA
jgi:hypothetical protein